METEEKQPMVIEHQPGIPNEERTLASLTHLSGLAGYVIPLGGVIVPIIIWIVKSESKVVSAIAKQALLLNVVIFLTIILTAILMLTIILIPFVLAFWLVLVLAAVVLPIVGAIKAHDGIYYRYPVVGLALNGGTVESTTETAPPTSPPEDAP